MLRLIARQNLISTASKSSFVRLASTTAASAGSSATSPEPSAPEKSIVSIAPAGTKLKGINIKKGGEDPVALAESEYPDWLWELLDPVSQKKRLEADPGKKAKKERRSSNRQKIKMNNFLAGMKN